MWDNRQTLDMLANWLFALVALAGVLGFAFKEKVFKLIERIYKTEKYSTIQAYKQNND